MSDAIHHPLDFEALKKGDSIGQAQIESIANLRFSDDPRRYSLEQLRLKEQIMEHRPDLVVVGSRNDLRILTDVEAISYCQARQEKDVRSIKRNVVIGGRVDRANLSDVEKRRADCLSVHVGMQAIEADRILRSSRTQMRLIDKSPAVPELGGAEEVED